MERLDGRQGILGFGIYQLGRGLSETYNHQAVRQSRWSRHRAGNCPRMSSDGLMPDAAHRRARLAAPWQEFR